MEAASLGIDSVGCDISSFNNLMSKVKTDEYDLELLGVEVHDALNQALEQPAFALREGEAPYHPSNYLVEWFAPSALRSLLAYQALLPNYSCSNVLKVILSRAARSARQTTHFDLDFPKQPQKEPYHCYKHSRICKPTEDAVRFLTRYSHDTLKRIREFSGIRKNVEVSILTGDSREVEFPPHDLVVTSPPYVGLIDYHEQHRYAYELLRLEWRANKEIGSASRGNSGRAQAAYVEAMTESFVNVKKGLCRNGRMVVIVNDRLGLYDEIREKSGFRLEARLERHVNRRTGRRSGDFYESILVWERKE